MKSRTSLLVGTPLIAAAAGLAIGSAQALGGTAVCLTFKSPPSPKIDLCDGLWKPSSTIRSVTPGKAGGSLTVKLGEKGYYGFAVYKLSGSGTQHFSGTTGYVGFLATGNHAKAGTTKLEISTTINGKKLTGKYVYSLDYELSGGGENAAKQLLQLSVKKGGSATGVIRSS
jgi:hypothetical protein